MQNDKIPLVGEFICNLFHIHRCLFINNEFQQQY